jgi:hypothetical protein
MARGDGSGGVGWLITFACLALVGLVGAGIFFIDSSSAHKAENTAKAAEQAANTRANNLTTQVGILNAIITNTNNNNADVIKTLEAIPGLQNHPQKAEIDKIINEFKAKIELFGPNYTEARNLNSLVTYLGEELNRKNAALVDEKVKTNKMALDLAKSIDENKKIAEAALEGQKKAEADLTTARADFDKQRADLENQMKTLAEANWSAKLQKLKNCLKTSKKNSMRPLPNSIR